MAPAKCFCAKSKDRRSCAEPRATWVEGYHMPSTCQTASRFGAPNLATIFVWSFRGFLGWRHPEAKGENNSMKLVQINEVHRMNLIKISERFREVSPHTCWKIGKYFLMLPPDHTRIPGTVKEMHRFSLKNQRWSRKKMGFLDKILDSQIVFHPIFFLDSRSRLSLWISGYFCMASGETRHKMGQPSNREVVQGTT